MVARQLRSRLAKVTGKRGGVVAGEAGQGPVVGFEQAGGMRLPAMGRGQRIKLGRVQGLGCQFAHLVFEPRDPFRRIACLGKFAADALDRGPATCQRRHGLERILVPPGGVEQVHLLGPVQQRLVLVLAVDFQQACAQRSQLRQGRGPAVDPGAGSAVGADDPPQLAVVALVQVVVA